MDKIAGLHREYNLETYLGDDEFKTDTITVCVQQLRENADIFLHLNGFVVNYRLQLEPKEFLELVEFLNIAKDEMLDAGFIQIK